MIRSFILNSGEELKFFGEEFNNRHDRLIASNVPISKATRLIFLDSRGISKSYAESLIRLCHEQWRDSIGYITVIRPFEITTWLTLYNFLKLNSLGVEEIITNMGFVDFTPKKKSIIEKSTYQCTLFFSKNDAIIRPLENYIDSNNITIKLYSLSYGDKISTALSNLQLDYSLTILNTPTLRNGFYYERKRPLSFHTGILKSNAFNSQIFSDSNVLDIGEFNEGLTYDGVHYTPEGNEIVFRKLLEMKN